MVSKELIELNLNNCLDNTDFLDLQGKRKGKVRDTYDYGENMLIVTTDRLSAFDRNIALIPFKGEVLNRISQFWFKTTSDIVPNHMLDVPDPNVMFVQKCRVLPIEFVVRGYLTGSTDTSAWTQYTKGNRNICGNILPEGMKKNQRFDYPILTPTTKSDVHDESISAQEIIQRGILDESTWNRASETVQALFTRGSQVARQHGLILVDTKYELGLVGYNNLVLIDEIHTPDSSRYWIADSFESRIANGQEPENIDKEFIRLWFRDHCDPYKDAVLPQAPAELVTELSMRYIRLYEMITGQEFNPQLNRPVQFRIKENLKKAGIHD
jgi:phosphoribosylaminoimidazole-succinocarboxamide synthase